MKSFTILKGFKIKRYKLNVQFYLSALLVFGLLRVLVVIYSNEYGFNALLPFVFISMALFPYVILKTPARRKMWIKSKTNTPLLLMGFLLGFVLALGIGYFGKTIFGSSNLNWFYYIRQSYRIEDMQNIDYELIFLISLIISMTFSPLGEEIFFRGFIHAGIRQQFKKWTATYIDCGAFALIHLCHFGIIYEHGSWKFLALPSLVWVFLMFLTALLFSIMRNKSNSLWGAILSHAGFNLGMTLFIFYLL